MVSGEVLELSCHGVSYERGNRRILNDVQWCCRGGRLTLLEGATGAGKSTLLGLLAGGLRPHAGEVRASGRPVSRWTALHRDQWRREIAVVPQSLALVEGRSALENVMLGLAPGVASWATMAQRAQVALAGVASAELAQAQIEALSMGERQRVAVARALVRDAVYVLADEPTAHQDAASAQVIMDRLAAVAARGAVVVVVTHDRRWDGVEADRWQLAAGQLSAVEEPCCNIP